MIPKKLIPAIAMLVLCGAGCFSKGADNAVNPSVTGTETGKTTSTANVGAGGKASGDASSTLVAIDDTWKTFHSNSGFSFRHPTKGALTPEWEVKNYDENFIEPGYIKALIQDGCVVDGSFVSKSTSGDFCHSMSKLEMPENVRIDYFALKKSDRYIVISFTKQLYSLDGCANLSVNRRSCVPFNEDDYKAILDTSMSTFKFDK